MPVSSSARCWERLQVAAVDPQGLYLQSTGPEVPVSDSARYWERLPVASMLLVGSELPVSNSARC